MKLALCLLLMFIATPTRAESLCDVRIGRSIGVSVIEFASGNVIHSKMALRDSSPKALLEEMTNLQDMGVCEEKILAKKCILRLEKRKRPLVTLFRGKDRWISWNLHSKKQAQEYVVKLKRVGFCS